jgi:predicted permease
MIVSDLRQDLRYAARNLVRSPGFAAVAVLIVGLGVGASTAVFSVVDALLLRSLPFREPERLVWIANTGEGGGLSSVTSRTSNLRDWRRLASSFDSLTGYFAFFDYGSYVLTGTGEPERLVGVGVARDFLEVLGVPPLLGRNFVEEEGVWNGPRAVILSHGFWQRRFGADPGVVGESVTLNGEATPVVGVLPPSFDFASVFAPGSRVDFLTPFAISDETDRWGNTLSVVGRLAPGHTPESAQADLDLVNGRLRAAEPDRWGLGAAVSEIRERVTGRFRRPVLVLAGAVGLVMLIVCANLSNLLLARASSRRRELAIRSAIGAGRSRLVRQLLTESLLLSGCGALAGVGLAYGITRAVAGAQAFSIPLLGAVQVDGAALLFASAAALLTGLLFGVAPALQGSGVSPHESLGDAGRGSSETRSRAWARETLVVAEVGLACVLVVGAGLLLRSFVTLLDVELGFRPEGVATWRIERSPGDAARRRALGDRLMDRVRALPGVESAGLTDALPLGRNRTWTVRARGEVYAEGETPVAFPRMVSDGYLETMGIDLLSGRAFTHRDRAGSEPVMIVNSTMAARLWPGRDPIGRVALLGESEWRVVGVVSDVRHGSLEEKAGLEMYLPVAQQEDWGSLELVVRSALPPETLAAGVREALQEVDPSLPRSEYQTLDALVERAVSPRRFLILLLGSFALAALLLAALGIYGVVSYGVNRRAQEIGIRMALGESAGQVRSRVVGRTLRLAGAGVVLGSLGAFALSRLMASLLYEVSPTDPATYGIVVLCLMLVAAIAGYLPALRASRTDPATVLRSV